MKQKITCFCDNIFEVETFEEINLDSDPAFLDSILDGSFMNFTCPRCGKKHKPEFKLSVLWPSKKIRFEVFPELDRGEFYRRKKQHADKKPYPLETIIGYPEMAERLAVIRDGYDPAPIESIKYYLYVKAEEQYPDDELEIWYYGTSCTPGASISAGTSLPIKEQGTMLEFHIHGIRENEVAVMKIPFSTYQKTYEDFKRNPKSEIFSALRVRSYLSVKNMMRPEELK